MLVAVLFYVKMIQPFFILNEIPTCVF